MLKTRILKTVFFAALALIGLLLLYISLVLHPSYHELLVENAENEAVRYVTFLVHAYNLDEQPMEADLVSDEVAQDIGRFNQDSELIKLRVFNAEGKIVFSTLRKEIGRINTHDYFHKKVALGEVYSKTVRKDSFTAEMEVVKSDLVETYVPIMGGGQFRGAIETYYDVTRSSDAIRKLTAYSLFFLGSVAFVLLLFLYYALRHADISIVARVKAEDDLRRSNEKLEERVAERAGELIRVNQSLNEEISERTLAQMALSEALSAMEEAKEKIDGILRSVNDGILVVDQDEQVVLMNGPAETIVGVSLSESFGQSIHDLKFSGSLNEALSEILAQPGKKNVDFELESSVSERPRILQARASVLRDHDETVIGAVVLMQDVSFERQIERMKSDFLAMAAHELMTPLASIMGYSELLSSEAVSQLTEEQKREFLNYIHKKAENLSRIVDDLLDISRIESGQKISMVKIEFDLCAALYRLVSAYQDTHLSHQFVLAAKCPHCRVYADPIRIEQVMENLISNAVKYSPEGGEVRFECTGDEQYCKLAISDQGVGMSHEQVEHVFDKFYRGDVSDTALQGIGLGMSIAKHIIDSHEGEIEVSSEPGKGTRVVFSLPRMAGSSIESAAGNDNENDRQQPAV